MFNMVEFICKYEDGELDRDQIVDGFQHLINSGVVWQLQGSYGRQAQAFINSGECTPAVKLCGLCGKPCPSGRVTNRCDECLNQWRQRNGS